MAGHSHWAGIKHKKEITDKKRGILFSKLLMAVTAAARTEPNIDFNPRLRTAVEKARANKVPAENIDRAIKKASDPDSVLEELLFEAYGPGGAALIIEVITASRNRAVAEIKHLLSEHGGKWAEPGSVRWAFEPGGADIPWKAKFPQPLADADAGALATLLEALESHDDVQRVTTNISS